MGRAGSLPWSDTDGSGEGTVADGRDRNELRLRWWAIAFAVPIMAFVVTQLDFAQNAEGWFVRGITSLDLGRKEVVADILAPIWTLSLVVAAAFDRRLIGRFPSPPNRADVPRAESWAMSDGARIASTWVGTVLAFVIIVMSWTREWERFGEQPPAFWYVLTILVAIASVTFPVWVVRHTVAEAIDHALSSSRRVRAFDRYLFAPPARWLPLLALAALAGVLAFVILAQLDALLLGMRSTGEAGVGINGLASVLEFDLTVKPAEIIERVGVWEGYSSRLGPGFASGYAVATLALVVDSVLLVPAYAVVVGLLLLQARRRPPEGLGESQEASYQFLVGTALVTLAVVVAADLVENLMTWTVIKRIWEDPEDLSAWRVRLMWFAALFRTVGLLGLVATGVLVTAFRAKRLKALWSGLVAIRGEILVVAFVAFSFLLAQTADVVRRWRVSTMTITVVVATALAMSLYWTASHALISLRRERRRVDAGETSEPSTVRLPWLGRPMNVRRAVVLGVFALAGLQVVLVAVIGVPAGLGFTVPAALITLLWLLGIPLPLSPYERGDRDIPVWLLRSLPRLVGSLVFVVIGVAVVSAAVPEIVYARHADGWLAFALVPLVLGAMRIHTRTWTSMGGLEVIAVVVIAVVAVVVAVEGSNPELSPVALGVTGVLFLFGSMPFFYSFDPGSIPSRIVISRASGLRAQPLFITGAIFASIAAILLILFPLRVAPALGTIAIVLIGAMLVAVAAAALVRFAEATRPPRILAAFRFRRTPVFLFLLAWIVLASLASTGASNDVTVVVAPETATTGIVEGVHVGEVFDRWMARNDDGREGHAVPLVIVAASGGGIRAAVWTSYVLDCLLSGSIQGPEACVDPIEAVGSSPVMVMSSVSGGSLGLAAFVGSTRLPDGQAGPDWVKQRLGDDYLAAPMAWLLLVDTPRSFIGFGPDIRDRADVLEAAWELSWKDDGGSGFLSRGVFEVWRTMPDLPLMVYNGTSVNDPCRFNASVLSAAAHDPDDSCTSLSPFEGLTDGGDGSASLAATKDLADYLCADQDIKLSTAALLSARFPIVTPSGRVGEALSECGEGPRAAYVVDGGYLEGSGAGTAMELWGALEPIIAAHNTSTPEGSCIVPFFVQIDNGYETPGESAVNEKPTEVLVPLETLVGSQFGRVANAREQAAIAFDRPLTISGSDVVVRSRTSGPIDSRYARITTRAHPGVQAPLGWTLSSASIDDLQSQLDIPENRGEIAEVLSWLAGDLTCETVSRR